MCMQFKYFLGVDVGKDELSIALRSGNEILWQNNVENEYTVLIKVFRSLKKEFGISSKESLVCMEATGMYNFHMLSLINSLQIPTWVVSGSEVKLSLGIQRGKSDTVDAKRISEYAMRFIDKVELWSPPRRIVEELKILLTARNRFIKCLKMLETPVTEMELFSSTKDFETIDKLSSKPIKEMKNALVRIEDKIDEVVKSDPDINESYNRLTSIKGVGKIIAVSFITATNEFKDYKDTKKIACHCGIAPFAYSSGKKSGIAHVNHKANKNLKTLLDMGARSAIASKGELQDYYQRKISEGKHKTCARNAVRYKLLSRIMAVERNKVMYDKNYSYRLA